MFMNYQQFLLLKICIVCTIIPTAVHSQQNITIQQYIDTYKYVAMSEMRTSGVPASIKLAQAILESGFGNSELATMANNHFGIKCHGWPGASYFYTDDEPDECFRKYADPMLSFFDHTEFLTTRPRYAFLFDYQPDDYKAWARGLRRAGYATNPQYANLLIRIIEEHNLYRFDAKALDPTFAIAENYSKLRRKDPSTTAGIRDLYVAREDVQREIRTYNRINYVVARPGDTPQTLARKYDIRPGRIIRYNDWSEEFQPPPGHRIYLQPKRRKGPVSYHIVREGETMADISHEYGIRKENLYRRNDMTFDMEPEPGQQLKLRGYEGFFFQYLFRRP